MTHQINLGSSNGHIDTVHNLITNFQTVLNSGDTSNISNILQQLIISLNGIRTQESDANITNMIQLIISNLSGFQGGNIDINSLLSLILSIQGNLNQYSSGGSSIDVTINKFQTALGSGNRENLNVVLTEVRKIIFM